MPDAPSSHGSPIIDVDAFHAIYKCSPTDLYPSSQPNQSRVGSHKASMRMVCVVYGVCVVCGVWCCVVRERECVCVFLLMHNIQYAVP